MFRQEFAKEQKRKLVMSMGSDPMDVGYTGERSVDSSELRKAEKIEGLPMKGLSHIPILACDYQELNKAISNPDSDDAKFISVGRALDDSKKSLSVKMFRRSNDRWSRQSEEVPIQRLPFMMAMMRVHQARSRRNSQPSRVAI